MIMAYRVKRLGNLVEVLSKIDPDTPLLESLNVNLAIMHEIKHGAGPNDIEYSYCYGEEDPDKTKEYGCCTRAKQYGSTNKIKVCRIKN